MPLYEYICERCGKRFEAIKPLDKRDEAECSCGGRGRRLLSRFFSVKEEGGGSPCSSCSSTSCSSCNLSI